MIWMSVFIKGTFAKVGAENGTQEVWQDCAHDMAKKPNRI